MKLSYLLHDLVDPDAGSRGLPLFDQFLCGRHFGGLQLLGEEVALATGLLVTLGGRQRKPHIRVNFVRSYALAAEEAGRQGDLLSKQLKPAEIMNAKKLVKQWKPARAGVRVNKIVQ